MSREIILHVLEHHTASQHYTGEALVRGFNDEKIELVYPAQTSFTAAPEGGLIMPTPRRRMKSTVEAGARSSPATLEPPSSGDRSAVDQ